MALLFADEDFPFPVVERLRQLGHDVLTTLETGRANQRIGDVDQLAFATSLGRAILTRNRRRFTIPTKGCSASGGAATRRPWAKAACGARGGFWICGLMEAKEFDAVCA